MTAQRHEVDGDPGIPHLQLLRILRRADGVLHALDDPDRDVVFPEDLHALEQLVFFQPGVIPGQEVPALHERDGRRLCGAEFVEVTQRAATVQVHERELIPQPVSCRIFAHSSIRRGQPPEVGLEEGLAVEVFTASLLGRDVVAECAPLWPGVLRRTVRGVEVSDVAPTREPQARSNDTRGVLRVALRIGKAQGGSPALAGQHQLRATPPQLTLYMATDRLHVTDEVPRGVATQSTAFLPGAGCDTTLAPHDDQVLARVELLDAVGRDAVARTAMLEHGDFPRERVAVQLHVDAVPVGAG